MEAVPSTRTRPTTEDRRGGQSCGPGEALLKHVLIRQGRGRGVPGYEPSWLGRGWCRPFSWGSGEDLGFTGDNMLDPKVSTGRVTSSPFSSLCAVSLVVRCAGTDGLRDARGAAFLCFQERLAGNPAPLQPSSPSPLPIHRPWRLRCAPSTSATRRSPRSSSRLSILLLRSFTGALRSISP